MHIHPAPDDDELRFASQLGLQCVYAWVNPDQTSVEYLTALRRKVESFGLTLYNVGSMEIGKSDKIHLALPGRDETIEKFKQFVRNLGRAGIYTTTFTWESTACGHRSRGKAGAHWHAVLI
jgi:mannonate dehydratase